jgi:hypothetical protein
MSREILSPELEHWFHKEGSNNFTRGHEQGHTRGLKTNLNGDNVVSGLQNGSVFEEAKADITSLQSFSLLHKKGAISREEFQGVLVSWLSGSLVQKNPFQYERVNHEIAQLMEINYFLTHEVQTPENPRQTLLTIENDRLSLHPESLDQSIWDMLGEVIEPVQLEGSYEKARQMIEKYARWTDDMQHIADKLQTFERKPYTIYETVLADQILAEESPETSPDNIPKIEEKTTPPLLERSSQSEAPSSQARENPVRQDFTPKKERGISRSRTQNQSFMLPGKNKGHSTQQQKQSS